MTSWRLDIGWSLRPLNCWDSGLGDTRGELLEPPSSRRFLPNLQVLIY
jgi:hypothetical protein